MKIPKKLYHGTSLLRWQIIKSDKKLKGHLPRYFKIDEKHLGWMYFTDNIQEAGLYALGTYSMDHTVDSDAVKVLLKEFSGGAIIEIDTTKIRNVIEKDPEWITMKKRDQKKGEWHKTKKHTGKWYRIKGHINLEFLKMYATLDPKNQNPKVMKIIKQISTTPGIEELENKHHNKEEMIVNE